MKNTISTPTVVAAREVVADISVLHEHLNFVSSSVTIEGRPGAQLVVRANQTVFAPFRIYQISFYIPHTIKAGTHPLGSKEDEILAHYLPPNTNQTDSYNAISGSITFYEDPTATRLRGTFDFKGRRFHEEHPEIADIRNGTLNVEVETAK
jgi:hypothetical protein